MIIGLAGTIGSGKGTVVDYLKSKGFRHYSSSGVLKEILAQEGKTATREHMSLLANRLLAAHQGGVLYHAHERAQQEGATDYILEAIHRTDEAAFVRTLGGIIIGIDADTELRYARITERHEGEKDNVTYEQFLEDAAREDEGKTGTGPNIRAVLRDAEAVILNNGSIEELHVQIDRVMDRLGSW